MPRHLTSSDSAPDRKGVLVGGRHSFAALVAEGRVHIFGERQPEGMLARPPWCLPEVYHLQHLQIAGSP